MPETASISSEHGWYRGDDFNQPFVIVDDDDVAVDITGWTIAFTVRRRIADADALITKTTPSGVALTDPTHGECIAVNDAADTIDLEPGRYVGALRRTDAGHVKTLWAGPVVLLQSAVH